MTASISVVGDGTRICKTFSDPAECRIEASRTADASAMTSRLDTFAVPEILENTGDSITFRRYHPSLTISQLVSDDFGAAFDLAGRMAAIITSIQDGLSHDVDLELPVEKLRVGHQMTFVHGDFTPDNVLVCDDELVVIDWCSSYWVPQPFNRAPEHWDLIWYIQCMYVRDFVGQFPGARRDAYCREVVARYCDLRPELDLAELSQRAIATTRHFHRHAFAGARPLRSRLRHSPRWLALCRFWQSYR